MERKPETAFQMANRAASRELGALHRVVGRISRALMNGEEPVPATQLSEKPLMEEEIETAFQMANKVASRELQTLHEVVSEARRTLMNGKEEIAL